jgi:hypothetical protein
MPIIGFNEEKTSGKRRIVPRGQTDGRADMSKLVVTPRYLQSLCEHSSLRREYTFEHSAASYIGNTSPFYVTASKQHTEQRTCQLLLLSVNSNALLYVMKASHCFA